MDQACPTGEIEISRAMTDIIRRQAAIKEGWGGGGERGAGHEKKKKMDNITTIVINRSKGREGGSARERMLK